MECYEGQATEAGANARTTIEMDTFVCDFYCVNGPRQQQQ